jgi:hypothetical protein
MALEGLSELASLAKMKGIKGYIGIILLIAVIVIIGLSLFSGIKILTDFGEKDIVFEGQIMDTNGQYPDDVKIFIEGAKCMPGFLNSDGKYSFLINSGDLPGKSFRLIFEPKNQKPISRGLLLFDNYYYHEIILK